MLQSGIGAKFDPIVNTRQSTFKFLDLAFDEAVQQAVNALLPVLTAQITNELRLNGAGEMVTNLLPSTPGWKGLESRSLDPLAPQPLQLMLKTGLLISRKCLRCWDQKYKREYDTICQREDELTDGIVNTEFTDVAQVANVGRNIELLHERGGSNNKKNRDGDYIQPAARNNNQKGYDQRRSDGHGYDRHNNNQRDFSQGEMIYVFF
uniref:Zinc finger, CCHC-type, retrotransposon Gag domain protein n=1 Tax=Tanacetum cinerariifolium TaxID=118510 RepID=A0A699I3K4_TANCI|nr:zinc finger, CCHC-type, retrotransposon Gag domain protein [Tanacetum cinerariifolium]